MYELGIILKVFCSLTSQSCTQPYICKCSNIWSFSRWATHRRQNISAAVKLQSVSRWIWSILCARARQNSHPSPPLKNTVGDDWIRSYLHPAVDLQQPPQGVIHKMPLRLKEWSYECARFLLLELKMSRFFPSEVVNNTTLGTYRSIFGWC